MFFHKHRRRRNGWSGGSRKQLCIYLAPLFAFLSQRWKWVMCFWLRPKVLMVITLLSLTLIISCLRGAITEASTSNSAELKTEKREKCAGSTTSHTECQEKLYIFDCFSGRQIAHLKCIFKFILKLEKCC